MLSLKNNVLILKTGRRLCKTHNGKSSKSPKSKLPEYKSYACTKTYHPLKKRNVKPGLLKFAANTIDDSRPVSARPSDRRRILSRRYHASAVAGSTEKNIWNNEEEIMYWLKSVGIEIKRLTGPQFLVQNKVCSLNKLLLIANRKRAEFGLSPFYVEDLTEY
jgi:hypothetical protein